MKLNKKKLIALGLASIMCFGPTSSVTFAEEELSDGYAEEFVEEDVIIAADDVIDDEAIVEEVIDVVGATTDGYVFVKGECPVKFIHPGDPDYVAEDKVTYKADAEKIICVFNLKNDKGEWKSVKADKVEKKANSERATATCTSNAGYIPVATLKLGDETIGAEDDFYITAYATGHHFSLEKTAVQN